MGILAFCGFVALDTLVVLGTLFVVCILLGVLGLYKTGRLNNVNRN